MDVPELFRRTEERLAEPARCSRISVGGAWFLVYHAGPLKLPQKAERCLEWVAARPPEQRLGMCKYRCEDLVRLGLAEEVVEHQPQDPDNVRGNLGVHFLARVGAQLVDPTWPPARQAGGDAPYGILCDQELLALVYG